ncbi:MAG: restriction endonuclease subunit S [Oscillibacter sp.]|nr:restriction endonuclease subunit S [Oscillibacter sp.]
MRKKAHVPAIRFAGFTEEWAQRQLGDVFEEYSEKNHPELPPLTIVQGSGTVLREAADRNLQYDKSGLSGYKLVRKDDFIVHLRSFEGGLEKASRDGVISPAYHTFHGENIDSRFYYPFFRSRYFIDVLLKPHIYGIRDGKSIDIEGMKTVAIPAPSYEEQRKIGEYMECLDNLIALHQSKYARLRAMKMAMLEKMFPKGGSAVPEIRWAGFTDPWERRELGECFTERVESLPEGELLSVTINEGLKKFSELGRRDSSNEDKSKYKKVCVGDIAYNSMRMWQGASGYSPYEGIVSPAYTVLIPNPGVDSRCVSYLFKCADLIHTFQVNSQGITSDSWNLKFPALSKIEIYLSGSVEEQARIARFFSQLDALVTLHQQKLTRLQGIKKSCLENMFV